jgi:hypothetical protein
MVLRRKGRFTVESGRPILLSPKGVSAPVRTIAPWPTHLETLPHLLR